MFRPVRWPPLYRRRWRLPYQLQFLDASNGNPLDLIRHDLVASPIVESRHARSSSPCQKHPCTKRSLCARPARGVRLANVKQTRAGTIPGENILRPRQVFEAKCARSGTFNAESGGGSPASTASCARYQSDLRAPKFCAAASPLVLRRTIVSKALSAAAASISGSDAWCRSLMISA